MTTDVREIFVTGLRNAHAMENQALSIMKPQISRIENYPEVKARLELHYRETEGQIARLEEILNGLSESASTIKDTALSMTGSLASLGHTVAGDEIIKNSLANFAFENYEIAAYKSLLTLSDHGGYQAAYSALRSNLEEEENMARWLEDNLEKVTLEFVALSEQGQSAKV
ncbi:ferritin-like domain-containing protein [Agrobacterium pusense]|uniref:ferritin-like domain-containing protein n=1 Tax=Agrobacterium pusense TaxID=648995 RepID=UPI001C6E1132|nr:ferritin-like domain-containing protein [Agrobacterium pusense]MBW9061583.1 ferritin-like domain-containing protein [Agrobacterium pusense]